MGRAVVTGFRAFPGVSDNPSQRLVEALSARPDLLPAASECRLIEVSYSAVPPVLDEILKNPPAALVLTGYSAQARGLRIETRAHDFCSPDHGDAFGFSPQGGGEIGEYLEQLRADLPAIAGAVQQDGIACTLSHDAGAYLCNHSYHQALKRIAERDLPTLAVFVHIPAIEGSDLAETSAAAMKLEDMMRGVAKIAAELAGAD